MIKNKKTLILTLLLIATVMCAILSGCIFKRENSATNELVIVSEKSSAYALVVPENSGEWLDFAAEEFNVLIKDVSGVELILLQDGEDFPKGVKNFISLGKTNAFKQANFSINYDLLKNDGFIVKNYNNNIYIDGNTDRAVLWGVYELIERYTGIRFLSQTYTYVPKCNTVKFKIEDFSCVPEFEQRDIIAGHSNKNAYYYRIGRFGEMGDTNWTSWATELGNIHTITDYYVKPSEWKKTHPEFFSSYTNDKVKLEDICWSNGITDNGKLDTAKKISVVKIVIDKIINQLQQTPNKEFFMLGMADQWNAQCKCDTCLTRAVGVNGNAATFGKYSGVVTAFCNVVAAEVNEWVKNEGATYGINHEVNIIQFAYFWSEEAPVKKNGDTWVPYNDIVKPSENVYVRIAPLDADYLYAFNDSHNSKYTEIIEQWAAITDNLMLYDYVEKSNLLTAWLPQMTYIQEQAQYLKDINLYYWMFEADYSNKGNGLWYINMFTYVLQHLWWDVNADVDAIVNEFIELYHGDAASDYVKEFYEIMQGNMDKYAKANGTMGVFGYDGIDEKCWSKETLDLAIDELNKAIIAVKDDETLSMEEKDLYIKNIREALLIPQSIMLLNYEEFGISKSVDALKYLFNKNASAVGLSQMTFSYTVGSWLENLGTKHNGVLVWEMDAEHHTAYFDCCDKDVFETAKHDFYKGVCEVCDYACEHGPFDENMICTICNGPCDHKHFSDGLCVKCGEPCLHESFLDGNCDVCNIPCIHTFDNGICKKCNYVEVVNASGLSLNLVDNVLIYTVQGGQCVTLANNYGKKWLSFDIMMDSSLGYAYLEVALNKIAQNMDILQVVKKTNGAKVTFTETMWSGANVMQNNVWYTVLVDTNNLDFSFNIKENDVGTTKLANVKYLDFYSASRSTVELNVIDGETVYKLIKNFDWNCNSSNEKGYEDNAFWFRNLENRKTLTFDFFSADFDYFQLTSGTGNAYFTFNVYGKVKVVNMENGKAVNVAKPSETSGGIWTGEVLPKNTWLRVTVDIQDIYDLGIIFWMSHVGTAQIKNIKLS